MARDDEACPQDLLRHYREYGVLLCQKCEYAIQPRAVERHLKDIHRILRAARRPYIAYANRYELREPGEVAGLQVNRFPLPFLPVFDGLECLERGCHHLCVSTKRMQKHWLAQHERHGRAGADWQPAPLQTFFRGSLLQYFTALTTSSLKILSPCAASSSSSSSSNNPWQPTDDELWTHFVTSTCKTMLTQDEHIWVGAIPRYAKSNPFLAHAVLACSALHLASKHPSRQGYLISAHSHQNIAMNLFRKAIVRVTEHNCHAIVAFSHLLIIFSLGTEQHDEHLLLTDASSANPQLVCSWLYFIGNACTMVKDQKDCIFSGPLRRLAECWDPAATEVDEMFLDEITERLLCVSTIGTDGMGSASDTAALEDAARHLGSAYAACEALGEGFTVWDAVRVWPMVVSMDYIRLLRQGNPAAMILMGHYCVLLKELQSMWFIGLYPLRLLYTIKRKLEPELHHHIDPLLGKWNIVF